MKICPLANMKWSNSCWLRIMNKKIRALFGGSQRTSLFTVIKYFFYKKTGNIKLFRVNPQIFTHFPWHHRFWCNSSLWNKQSQHGWSNVRFSKRIQLCEMALENGSAEQATGSGPCLYLVVVSRVEITEVYKSNKVRYKEQWLKKNAFNPRIKDFNSKWYKVQRQSRKRGKAKS